MKTTLTLISILIFCVPAYAQDVMPCSPAEAQIIAIVGRVEASPSQCLIFPDFEQDHLYNHSIVCPLLIEDVMQNGISMPMPAPAPGHGPCQFKKGDTLSGVLVMKHFGHIYLE